jgi:serine/threonine-protein phosphatase 6 regulatory ankyrin repeat subunit B
MNVIKKTMLPGRITYPFVLLFCFLAITASCKGQEDYREALKQKEITLTQENFFKQVKEGNRETVELFIKAGMDVNIKDAKGITALVVAVNNGNNGLAELLIDSGADVNVRVARISLLLLSLYDENYALAKLLIEEGIDVNIQDNNGMTALMIVVGSENLELTKLLIKKGADVKAVDDYGRTALMLVPEKETGDFARIADLLRKAGAKE